MDKILRNKLRQQNNSQAGPGQGLKAGRVLLFGVLSFLMLLGSSRLNQTAAATLPVGNPLFANFSTDPFNMDLGDNILGTAEKHVSCYPNPAVSYINFKLDKAVAKDSKLFIFSFTGKQMAELALTGSVIKVTLENYYRGLYVYQLRSPGGAILESGKFQVKN
ncbi:Por secretion system C-terminal sorting domain-containing protein [Arachidicoccus rhizosphaerae]|uniref:Por secretion system C-terminal sorting domain-containing protein n=1 Tax=Arachidicoccus rhizosphaerae TaxID=551991 RepID=A0A1H4BU42_9BACT|nr:T9SS type A sorting domain-containing protein [Arachidicoccus rhizosphaerae]SEA51603.1 Por secretion system C-terminal sorting domain-containing protein [Arachidicoccus rhizosphaerae]